MSTGEKHDVDIAFGCSVPRAHDLERSHSGECRLSWEVPAADTKYTKQFALEVGDIPGHQIRIYELHRVYPSDRPNCKG
jgi:hypothetical protein